MKTQGIIIFISLTSILLGCGAESRFSSDTDTGFDTATEIDTGTGTETDTGTEESLVPPELPSLCNTSVYAEYLSGTADGQTPTISTISSSDSMMAWAYDVKEAGSNFLVELASFDAAAGEYTAEIPFADSVISTNTRMTNNGMSHGLVWIEGRSAWDEDCTPEGVGGCDPDVAMATITNGQVNETAPIRVSQTGQAMGKPSIVAVSGGWVVAWGTGVVGKVSVMAAYVNAAGVVGAPINVSGEVYADDFPQISMAVYNNAIVLLWRGISQNIIYYRMLNATAQATTAPLVLAEGNFASAPSAISDTTGFMVSYSLGTTDDSEVFTRRIQPNGQLVGQRVRLTWTASQRTIWSALAHMPGGKYGVAWLSKSANGNSTCVDSVCSDKVFASILNSDGALAAEPILVSEGEGDLNPASDVVIGTNGAEWLVAYELRKNYRQQIVYSTFSCQ